MKLHPKKISGLGEGVEGTSVGDGQEKQSSGGNYVNSDLHNQR